MINHRRLFKAKKISDGKPVIGLLAGEEQIMSSDIIEEIEIDSIVACTGATDNAGDLVFEDDQFKIFSRILTVTFSEYKWVLKDTLGQIPLMDFVENVKMYTRIK